MGKATRNKNDKVNGGKVSIIKIIVNEKGEVGVEGFPINMLQAISIMTAAVQAVTNHFAKMARLGKLDAKGTMVENRIIQANPNDILKLNNHLKKK